MEGRISPTSTQREGERDRKKEESLLFQLSQKIVFVVFEQNGKKRKKTGEKEFC
jgi:hypothetical protein